MWPLFTQSYWRDEAFSVLLAGRPLQDIFRLVVEFDHTPPLFYYIQHFWIGWFGDAEAALRSLSLAALLAAAAVVGCLSRNWLAGLALLINPLLWGYGHEARHYSFYLLLVLAAVYAFEKKQLVISNLLWALALWTHNFAWFYYGTWLLLTRDWRLLPAGLSGSLWLPFGWLQAQSLGQETWLALPGAGWWRESLKMFFGYWPAGAVWLAVALLRPNRWAVLAVAPPLLTYLISRLWTPLYLERYLLPSLGFALIYWGRRRWNRLFLVIYLLALLPLFIQLNRRPAKPNMRQAAAQIAGQIRPEEIIITEQPLNYLEMYYYLRRYGFQDRLYSRLYPSEKYIPDYVGVELIKPEEAILAAPAGRAYWLVNPDSSVVKSN
jgi:hypothetical protein